MNDPLFWIPTHNDSSRLAHCLYHLRRWYPEAPVVVYIDRDPQRELSTRLARRFGCLVDEYLGHVHWARPERVREIHVNRCRWHLKSDAVFSLKLDTDALVMRRLETMPEKCLFGRLIRDRRGRFIQGGAVGCDRNVARRIVDTEPPSLDELAQHVHGSLKKRHQPRDEHGHPLCSEDRYLGWLAQTRNIAVRDYPPICSYWRRPIPPDKAGQAAIIHPASRYDDGERIVRQLVARQRCEAPLAATQPQCISGSDSSCD